MASLFLIGVDTSLIVDSICILIISIIVALFFLFKLIGTIQVYFTAKKFCPNSIESVKKEMKRYIIIFASILIFGCLQFFGVIWIYIQALSTKNNF